MEICLNAWNCITTRQEHRAQIKLWLKYVVNNYYSVTFPVAGQQGTFRELSWLLFKMYTSLKGGNSRWFTHPGETLILFWLTRHLLCGIDFIAIKSLAHSQVFADLLDAIALSFYRTWIPYADLWDVTVMITQVSGGTSPPFISFVLFPSPTHPLTVTWWRPAPVDVSSAVCLTTRPTATP